MGKLPKIAGMLAGASMLSGAELAPPGYAEGQIWEYRTRSQDAGSLLKIQKIEAVNGFGGIGTIYHVSIIGVRFVGMPLNGVIAHAPFARSALDRSVTRLSASKPPFPDATEGIAQWRAAGGGVFTISVEEAIEYMEQTVRAGTPAPGTPPSPPMAS